MGEYRTDEHDEIVTIEIGTAVALVVEDLLDRWTQSDDSFALHIRDDAEWHALSVLAAALESQLAELFLPDYDDRLATARHKIVARWGAVRG